LAERAYIAYSRHLLDNQKWLFSKNLTQREAIRNFLPWLDEVIEKHPEMVYPPYYKAKLLLKTGENEQDTLDALRPFVQRKSNEFWAWETMADVFQENDDRKLACLCKALSFNSSEEFIINLRHKMASELIKREHYQAAKAEIEKIVEIREQNGWNILNTVKEWQNQEWYQSTQANQDNTELYQKNAPQADEILYEDTPEKNVVVEFVNKHKKVLNFVKDQSFSGFFNYAGYLDKPEIGDILKVRLKQEGNEGYHKVLTLQKDDETKEHPAITDFQGQIKLKPPHNFGLVISSDNGKIFIHSKMVEKNKIEDKTGISGKAVLSYNKKRGEWEWKAIIVNG
jgi:hypothetical protein